MALFCLALRFGNWDSKVFWCGDWYSKVVRFGDWDSTVVRCGFCEISFGSMRLMLVLQEP